MVFEHLEEKEAVKTAAIIEVNGYAFYTLLSKKAEDKEVKAILKKLAEDEKRHLRVIENKFFPEAGFPAEDITDEELEIEEYVERSARADIFTKKINVDDLVKVLDSPKKALLLALDTERHSVEFFTEMARKAETEDARTIYRELVDEEAAHVRQIEGLIASV